VLLFSQKPVRGDIEVLEININACIDEEINDIVERIRTELLLCSGKVKPGDRIEIIIQVDQRLGRG
jgi:hypothetical protein